MTPRERKTIISEMISRECSSLDIFRFDKELSRTIRDRLELLFDCIGEYQK